MLTPCSLCLGTNTDACTCRVCTAPLLNDARDDARGRARAKRVLRYRSLVECERPPREDAACLWLVCSAASWSVGSVEGSAPACRGRGP